MRSSCVVSRSEGRASRFVAVVMLFSGRVVQSGDFASESKGFVWRSASGVVRRAVFVSQSGSAVMLDWGPGLPNTGGVMLAPVPAMRSERRRVPLAGGSMRSRVFPMRSWRGASPSSRRLVRSRSAVFPTSGRAMRPEGGVKPTAGEALPSESAVSLPGGTTFRFASAVRPSEARMGRGAAGAL